MTNFLKPFRQHTLDILLEHSPVVEYEKHIEFQKFYKRQKSVSDETLENDVNELISKIIGKQPDDQLSLQDKLDFLMDEYNGEDDEKLLSVLRNLELSDVNWEKLTNDDAPIFIDEGNLFNKATNYLQRKRAHAYWVQNKEKIKKKKRILQNRISSKAKKKRDAQKRANLHQLKKNHVKSGHHINELLAKPKLYVNNENVVIWSPDKKYKIGEKLTEDVTEYLLIRTKRKL